MNTMTNAELSEAIQFAHDRSHTSFTEAYATRETETSKVMLDHLKALLAVQRARAGAVVASQEPAA